MNDASDHSGPRKASRRILRRAAWGAAALFVALNALAWMQARSMTHFRTGAAAPPRPDSMSTGALLAMLTTGASLPRPVNLRTPASLGLPYTQHVIDTGPGDSIEVWAIPGSRRNAIVILVHGYGADKEALLPAASRFHDLGYGTVLVDFRGSGGSSGDRTSLGYHEADDVDTVVRWSTARFPGARIILCGGSMGAVAILRAVAVHHVHADALILDNPFDSMVNAVRNRFRMVGLPAFPAAELMTLWGGVDLGFNGFAHAPADYAAADSLPTLMFEGSRDTRATPEQTARVFRAIPGRKDYVLVEGAGHVPLVEAAPDLWRERTVRFLGHIDSTLRSAQQ